jgi:C1A family cysteine protease
LRVTGINIESSYPYTASNGSCSSANSNWQTGKFKVVNNSYSSGGSTIDIIKNNIYSWGPIVAVYTVYDDFFDYTGGVYSYSSGDYAGLHAVLVVGWDDANGAFIVKNSWGADWGESGYFRIVYSEVNGTTRFGNEIYTLYQGANYQCSALPVRIAETNTYHSTIASAYAAALDGQTIQTRHMPPFEEDLFSNRNILLKHGAGMIVLSQ